MRKLISSSVLAIATIALSLGVAAAKPAKSPAKPAAAAKGNWLNRLQALPNGAVLIGNPEAKIKLVEFVRYTCSHCAAFEVEGGDSLRMSVIATGEGSLELRPFLANPVDLTASLLVQCGPPAKFAGNSSMFLRTFAKWGETLQASTPLQQQRWSSGEFSARMRAIAADLGFYETMASRGYDRVTIDRCLANQALAQKLAALSKDAVENVKIEGTPSFMINGELQSNVYNWPSLRARLIALNR